MTVSTEIDHNEYIGNGVTTSFPYTFRVFKKTDLVVTKIVDEDAVILRLDTDYTVTGAGGYRGGNVVLKAPLESGVQISIARELPVTQETDLRNQGKFYAEVHEDAFDKLTMLIQQLRSWFTLSLRRPSIIANYYDALGNYIRNLRDPSRPQDAATKNYVDNRIADNTTGWQEADRNLNEKIDRNHRRTLRATDFDIHPLPPAEDRAGKVPSFDQNGQLIVVAPASGSAVDVLNQLAGDKAPSQLVNYLHVFNGPTATFESFIAKYGSVDAGFIAACSSGISVLLRSDISYDISETDTPVASSTKFMSASGAYAQINIMNLGGKYGFFNLSNDNGLNGGRYNHFSWIKFRHPTQKTTLDETTTAPIACPPIFHGGAYGSEFINLDVGNCYIAFRLGGTDGANVLGTASRVVIKDIIGHPLYLGLSLEQVRDVPTIQNIRWNYNYLDDTDYEYNAACKQWIHDNGIAFQIGRVDWATFVNLFSFGYFKHIYLRSTRYTGSADRVKFVGCHCDHTVYPLHARNFTNRVDFEVCHFVGDYDSFLTASMPNICFIEDVGDPSAVVVFTASTIFNMGGTAVRSDGTRLVFLGGDITKFGMDSTGERIRNGIEITKATTIKIMGTRIDASSGAYTRCVHDGGNGDSKLIVGSATEFIGATFENYRWDGGVTGGNIELISPEALISGKDSTIRSRGPLSFYLNSYEYNSAFVPVSGSFVRGDFVKNTNPAITGTTGSRYFVDGWRRMTTGSSHVINTDWVVIKVPTGD